LRSNRARGPVAAVGFTGQVLALVTLDSAGDVVAPVKLWLDIDGALALESFVRRVHAGSAAAMACSRSQYRTLACHVIHGEMALCLDKSNFP
jgi:sugar (pentulose or hexulose) kinase